MMFDKILNATLSEEKVCPTGVTQGNLELPSSLNSFDSHQTTKTIRLNFGVTPRPNFLEGKLIHWGDEGKTFD